MCRATPHRILGNVEQSRGDGWAGCADRTLAEVRGGVNVRIMVDGYCSSARVIEGGGDLLTVLFDSAALSVSILASSALSSTTCLSAAASFADLKHRRGEGVREGEGNR